MTRQPLRAQELLELARTENRSDRERLYEQIAALFEIGDERSRAENDLLIEIMRALSRQVDMRLRLALAERLADRPDADHDLILLLARDDIEIASPVILRSVVLTDTDLVDIIRECSPFHSVRIAGRPRISASVCLALVDTERHDVARALSQNGSAQISDEALERLAEFAKEDPALLRSLIERPRLPKALAVRMFSWASVALKQHIAERFEIEPPLLQDAVAHAASDELAKRTLPDSRKAKLSALVEKLRANGHLKPGFLLKALREDQMDLFRIAFARLLDIDETYIHRILDKADPVQVALAARAAGIDRSAFPTILSKLGASLEGLAQEVSQEVEATLGISPPSLAREELLSGMTA